MAIAEIDRPVAGDDPRGPLDGERAGRPAASRVGGGHLPYFPALDGLRGLAVISVLFFHAGFSWAIGGYLGVSTFFTLSGFLITSLLLAENTATGGLDLRAFWTRRFRRLMPAAIAAMGLAVAVAVIADPVARANIGGDIASATGYVANWRFIFSGKSYAELFSSPSPVQHFWSLAIEEQFYLLYPLLAFAIMRVAKGSRALFGAILGLLTAASVVLPLYWGFSHDRIYYGTDARAAELLIGGMLAVALYYRPITNRLASSRTVQLTMAAIGAVALAVCVLLWFRVDQASDGLYLGGFFGYSVLTVLVIVAALLPLGPVATVLSTRPMRYMGKISYGVYLYHWPIFMAVDEAHTPLSGLPLFVVRVGLTMLVAIVSYRYLETPIRKGEPLFPTGLRIRPLRIAPVALVGLLVVAVVVGLTAPRPAVDFAQAQQDIKFSDAPPPVFDPNSSTPPRPRMATFGDSTALMTGLGLNDFLTSSGKGDAVSGLTPLGCSLIRGGWLMNTSGMGRNAPECNNWEETFKVPLEKNKPNIAVIQDGPWEVLSHQFEDEPMNWYTIGQPRFDDYLTKEMLGVIDLMSSHGAEVFWLTLPKMGAPKGQDPLKVRGAGAEPERAARFNEIVRSLPALRPGKVRVIDLADWLAKSGEDERLRPDGVHFSNATAIEVAQKFLVDAIIKQFDDDWVAARKADFEANQGGQAAPARTLVVGDSTAAALGQGMASFGTSSKTLSVGSVARAECGIGRGGARKNQDKVEAVPKDCQTWDTTWPAAIEKDKPDAIVVASSEWDLTDRQLDGDKTWRAPGDRKYDDYLGREYAAAADALHKYGQPVLWLTTPPIDVGKGAKPNRDFPVDKPERAARLNEIIREVARTRPWLRVVDFADYAKKLPDGRLDSMRPDGVDLTTDAASQVTKDWLAQQVLDAVRDYRQAVAAASGSAPVQVPSLPK